MADVHAKYQKLAQEYSKVLEFGWVCGHVTRM